MGVRNSTYVQYTVKLIYGQDMSTRPKPVVYEHLHYLLVLQSQVQSVAKLIIYLLA